MGSRHRRPAIGASRTTLFLIGASAALVFAILAAGAAQLLTTQPTRYVGSASQPQTQPVTQDGRLVAVTSTSVTALSPDGFARTYAVTPETTSVTRDGGHVGLPALPFALNDEVSIVGEVRGDTAVATAVAARDVTGLNGPPMDYVAP